MVRHGPDSVISPRCYQVDNFVEVKMQTELSQVVWMFIVVQFRDQKWAGHLMDEVLGIE